MKQLIIAFMLILSMSVSAQQGQTVTVKAKTEVATQQSLTKTATKTSYNYKGLPVYKSSKGSYFVVRQSKKTGNWYKQYVTIE